MSEPVSGNDVLGWHETRWGMTPAEVCAAVGQELRSLPKREEYKELYADYFIPAIDIAGEKFQVVFQMSASSGCLSQVVVRLESDPSFANEALFQSVRSLLAKKYGAATLRTGQLPDNAVARWVFPTTTVEIRNLFVAGIISQVSIIYRPTRVQDTANL
jgi:hypothetical protein